MMEPTPIIMLKWGEQPKYDNAAELPQTGILHEKF